MGKQSKIDIVEEGFGYQEHKYFTYIKIQLSLISTLFIFAVLRIALLTPTLLNRNTLIAYDAANPGRNIADSINMQGYLMLIAEYALGNFAFLFIVIFLFYGLFLFFADDFMRHSEIEDSKLREIYKISLRIWTKVFSWTITISAFIITILSVYKG